MNENIDVFINKLFKGREQYPKERLKLFNQKITEELSYFSFHSMNINENGNLPIEEFSKNILSNLKPNQAMKRIKMIDHLVANNKIKGEVTYNDFCILKTFFIEYKKYFKLEKTSNFSRSDFKNIFKNFTNEYNFKFNNEESIDNLYSLIDIDENENLEYRELKTFLFKAGTGGRGEKKNMNIGVQPINDIRKNFFIAKDKIKRIINIILE